VYANRSLQSWLTPERRIVQPSGRYGPATRPSCTICAPTWIVLNQKRARPERTAGGPSIFDHCSWWKFDLQLFRKEPVLGNSAGWLLTQLQNAHERVLSGLTDLDRLLEKPDPDIPSYLASRSRLSSATRARSFAVQAAHEYLLDRADQATEDELARLFHARRRTLGLSAEHMSTWSSWAISVSWSCHRSAQRALRSHWVDLVELEKEALYPMLARHAQ
jgi:hypothetical protein